MRNANKKKISSLKLSGIIFIIAGIVFIVVSMIMLGLSMDMVNNGVAANGEIVGLSDNGTFIIEYTAGGVTYREDSWYYSSMDKVGDTITIYYHKDTPEKFEIVSPTLIVFIVFVALGGSFLTAGLVCYIIFTQNRRRIVFLRKYGRKIEATIKSIEINKYVQANGKKPVFLICVDEKGNEYKSGNIFLPPDMFRIGGKIAVYENRYKKSKYFVDCEKYIEKKDTQGN